MAFSLPACPQPPLFFPLFCITTVLVESHCWHLYTPSPLLFLSCSVLSECSYSSLNAKSIYSFLPSPPLDMLRLYMLTPSGAHASLLSLSHQFHSGGLTLCTEDTSYHLSRRSPDKPAKVKPFTGFWRSESDNILRASKCLGVLDLNAPPSPPMVSPPGRGLTV